MAAAFAGVAARLRRQLPDHAARRRPHRDHERLDRSWSTPTRSIDLTANLYFGIGSTILLTVVLTLVTTRVVEKRLGALRPRAAQSDDASLDADEGAEVSPEADSQRAALRACSRRAGRARRRSRC